MDNVKIAEELLKIAKEISSRNWKYKWQQVKSMLNETRGIDKDDLTDEMMVELAKRVSNLLERKSKQIKDEDDKYDIEDIIEQFKGIENVEEFNEILELLYDWADGADVWLG